MRLPVIIINDCWEYIIEVEVFTCMNEDVNLVVYWRGGTAYNELAYKIVRTEMLVLNTDTH